MTDSPKRRAERVRHEVKRREVHVVGVEPVGASLLSITLGGEDLAGFTSLGFDDHVKFIFDNGGEEPEKRDLTPRRWNPELNQLTLELAFHEGGAACEWVKTAEPGAKCVVGGPKSSIVIPVDYDWHVLVGDLTAVPAIARRLEQLPAGCRAYVFVLAPLEEDRRELTSDAKVEQHWAASEDELIADLRALPFPAGEGFVWCAGESHLMAQLREVVLREKEHPLQSTRIAGYWMRGAKGEHSTLVSGLDA
ncbi:siderophore-interacting protein [Novosphingobium flavum]|uniref:Siderophore-interacting protein n=1 Tax=Novosphingobium flavum TaxID=1778672 RepID=A0A7X1FRY8_9SPHN|nr:siderophore-interacting protein [Novosphingobium flavum]MBC2665866.1 siderophore-interacting protein [Novosphingobium flavum]